jgi:hypothetical protein
MAHINRNFCKTFNLALDNVVRKLADQECSEVLVCAPGGVTIFDKTNPTVGFYVPKDVVVTIKGVTNSFDLSATGSGTLSYRTQFYSGLQQTFV